MTEKIQFEPNVTIPNYRGIRFMVSRAAEYRDALAVTLRKELGNLNAGCAVTIGTPSDLDTSDGTVGIRVVNSQMDPHLVATDVILKTVQNDLFIEISGRGRSPVRYARPVCMTAIWLVVVLFIFTRENALDAMLLDYAVHRSPDPYTYMESLKYGYGGSPWTIWTLIHEDPLLVLTRVATLSGLIAVVFWLLTLYRPDLFVRPPCALMRWPQPEQLHAMIKAQASWVQNEVGQALLDEGFDEREKIPVE